MSESIFEKKEKESNIKLKKKRDQRTTRAEGFVESKRNKTRTLCWKCNAEFCEWIVLLKPVPGWNAIKTTISSTRNENGKCYSIRVPSYCVIECPKFVGKK